jgi:hypothetical protein
VELVQRSLTGRAAAAPPRSGIRSAHGVQRDVCGDKRQGSIDQGSCRVGARHTRRRGGQDLVVGNRRPRRLPRRRHHLHRCRGAVPSPPQSAACDLMFYRPAERGTQRSIVHGVVVGRAGRVAAADEAGCDHRRPHRSGARGSRRRRPSPSLVTPQAAHLGAGAARRHCGHAVVPGVLAISATLTHNAWRVRPGLRTSLFAKTSRRWSPDGCMRIIQNVRRFVSMAGAVLLAAFAAWTVFVVVRAVTITPPKHGHSWAFVPSIVLLVLLAGAAAHCSCRLWRTRRASTS